MDKVDGNDAAGLRGQEVLPGRARAAGRGADPGIAQDPPRRGGCDLVAEPDLWGCQKSARPVSCSDDQRQP